MLPHRGDRAHARIGSAGLTTVRRAEGPVEGPAPQRGYPAPVIIVPPGHHRSDRVAAAMREEIATFLANEVKDPRILGLVTVTGVDVTRDLRHARIFVSVLGSESQRSATFEGLDAVAGHLRGRVGRALRLRVAPELEFRNDTSIAHAAHIEQLLAQVRKEPASDSAEPVASSPATDSPRQDDEGRDD